MPFVERVVSPKYLSATSLRDADGRPRVTDEELQAVTNCTLSNALRQLASLVLHAEDIFGELTSQLQAINERSKSAQTKLDKVGDTVQKYDPKKVTVPEGSLSDFAQRKVHYKAKLPVDTELFTPGSRPAHLRKLCERTGSDGLTSSLLDQLRKDSEQSPFLLCTPVLSTKHRRAYRRVDVEIETRIPSSVEHLRKWTSKEAIGEVTAPPDSSLRIASCVTLTPDELSDVASGDDEPIDHRLPSPEEQLRIITSKFLPEMVPINTTGKFFDRMCTSRKSLSQLECGLAESDTVKRRTRSRKPRGKRRNTISGTDQKELREAIAGDTSTGVAQEDPEDTKVVRSHSSDLLKKSPIDPTTKKGHFNSLKQWGKNRLKKISRSPSASRDSFKETLKTEKKEAKSPPVTEETNVQETVTMRRKRAGDEDRRSLQRCGSYSSSEKSIGLPNPQTTATINTNVKLRGTSQRRLRRTAIGKDEPHSSSGNWSASSESGRTSIGSEITTTTVPPKSTTSAGTSNNSLNIHHGPPSSIISRRRFLNNSGSGSVTSEGTLTPDIIHDLHDDMETSSEFSCDTEGYYTSFHMDSGLKTLKEEELSPSTPMHTTSALTNSSSNSQNLTAESEYELFGKGSTSTTTSSAGTVCTTLMAAGSDRSLIIGPTVPERKSSLTKLNRSKTSVHSANASLDRSKASPYSKSPFSSLRYNPVRSCNERKTHNHSSPEINDVPTSKITITQNVGNHMTALAEIHQETDLEAKKSTGTSSPDSGHNTSSSPIEDSVSSAHGKHSLSEQDYSESSDLEGTDRIERIRYKTTINSSRIPSLCVITPNPSDDESENSNKESEHQERPKLELPVEEKPKDTKSPGETKVTQKPLTHINLRSSLQPLNNLMCKLKGVLPHKLKKSPTPKEMNLSDGVYDAGDYVTIADVKNNNQKMNPNRGVYGNDVVKKNLQTVLSGILPDTEYVSLNELPNCLNETKDYLEVGVIKPSPALEEIHRKGAKVTLDSHGQVIYSSDTLKRRKGAHTTFEPGPFVQEVPVSQLIQRQTVNAVQVDETDFPYAPSPVSRKPLSPQLGKVIIKAPAAPGGPVTTELVRMPAPKPSTIIAAAAAGPGHGPAPRALEPAVRGAYVNIHDAHGVSLSPTKDDLADYRHSSADKPTQLIINSEIPPMADMNPKYPSLQRQPTAHIRGRHGFYNYDNQTATPRAQPVFWTLPKRTVPDMNMPRSHTYEQSFDTTRTQPYLQEPPRTSNQSNFNEESIRISPIDPRTNGAFKSSTPSNKENVVDLATRLISPVKSTTATEDLYAVIQKNRKKIITNDAIERSASPALSSISMSPVNTDVLHQRANRYPETGYLGDPRSRNSWSVPSDSERNHYPRSQRLESCADRHGPAPQISRLDFKKLLLQQSVKQSTLNPQSRGGKLSAVERLKLSKENMQVSPPPAPNRSQINILDLSGSPKTYTQRKVIKPVTQPPSPGRANALIKEHKNTPKIMLSPKAQWRFASPRSDVLSSPIPEANNEDESTSSGEKLAPSPTAVPVHTNQHFGARRNLIPINENAERDTASPELSDQGVFPLHTEVSPGMSRTAILQAKRAEFFSSTRESSPPKFSSFKFTSPSAVSRSGSSSPEKRTPSPNALETAL